MGTIDYYNENAEYFIDSTINVDMSETQDLFLSILPNNSKILDFGCGSGRDTKYFLEKGHQVDAIDGSEKICEIVSSKLNIEVKCMDFFELDSISEYDGIWACASLLHVNYRKLPEMFDKLYLALKPNGVLYASFKYGGYSYIDNGKSYTNVTEKTIRRLLKNSEFVIEKEWITSDGKNRKTIQWFNIILRKRPA